MISSSSFHYIKAGDKFSAIEEVISCCSLFDNLPISKEEYLAAVIQREKLQSTYLGHGVIAAHGKINGLGKTKIALGISEKGIADFDGVLINFIFVIASDEFSNLDYLKCLSAILSWVHEKAIREELLSRKESEVSEKFYQMLQKQDFRVYCG